MSTLDHVTRRQEEYKTQYDQLTAHIEAVRKDLGRALDSEQKLVLEQRLQDLTAERERVVEQLTYLEQNADDIRAGKIVLPGLPEIGPAPGPSPYKGLQYFDVADAPNFFGREALAAELAGYLREHSLLAVVGASGSGKSSLMRAGLIPALKQNQPLTHGIRPPAGSDRWLVHIITPTARPLESLAISLTRDSESVTASATLIDDLGKDPRSLSLYTRRLLSTTGVGDRLLLVVDQFEELFTLCKDRSQRKAFVDALLTAACPDESAPCAPAQSVVSVVWTLRADFYAYCAEFENLRVALQDYQRFIGTMSQQELRRVIEEPARQGGWELESGLVEVLLRDVGDEPGALPLLSHALLETWKRRRGRIMTLAGYVASGRVQGAIAKTADDVYDHELTPDQQAIARNIFLQLTGQGEGHQYTRRRVTLSQMIPLGETAEGVQVVLEKLVDARLVTTYDNGAEVAHEALIQEWPALQGWLEENREALWVQRRLSEAAHEWDANNRDVSYLYRGTRLVEAEERQRVHGGNLSQLEAAFLRISLALRDQETARLRRRLVAAALIGIMALVIAAIAGVGWIRAREQTRFAEDRTDIARMLLGVQRDLLAQVETGRLTKDMLRQQRQQLEQGDSVLASRVAPKAILRDLKSANSAAAQRWLNEACWPQPCLRSQLRWETNDEIAGGLILRSEPTAGEDLLWGTAVTLTVSQGRPVAISYPVTMELVPIPAGEFLMGSDRSNDPEADDDELPQHKVVLSEFYIGKHEVTNAQYEACVTAGKCNVPSHWESGMIAFGQEDHPVVNVSGNDAAAFTEWLSVETGMAFRLCTEAEWEKACRATTGFLYPWGDNAPSREKLNYTNNMRGTTLVGSYSPQGDSPFGVADMAGNVWEWVADRFDESYYTNSPSENPQGPLSGDLQVLRGGSFYVEASNARCAARERSYPYGRFGDFGFRVCAVIQQE